MLDPIYVPEDFLVPAVVWTVGTPSEAESVGAGMERGNSWNLECNISGQHFRIFGHILKVQTRHFLDRSDTWEPQCKEAAAQYDHPGLLLSLWWTGKGTRKKWPVFVVFYYEGGEGRRKCKILRNFFISHVFVGVFQNYPGPLKHASELRDYVKYMFSFLAIFFVPFPNSLSINLK